MSIFKLQFRLQYYFQYYVINYNFIISIVQITLFGHDW